ncbi:hypothetical protein UFOVP1138_58 [uncultured Caudovirales phage]|uniref:Uncharacterized protein n=1 Tax=uncultured Caudovirales phage TaxID=2100421 RepID=A0A6J5S7I6_9CAUD|nr:hypothetical protein UFOVP975_62 [uncultured Caudovirales phage]CAB4186285.1 hypothetical protein UFOVP1138_58 [uncultured Caudovirales phage]CAB4204435.1 hypothetical protein UFOVP1394_55 [uncultured Caudovirales phage]
MEDLLHDNRVTLKDAIRPFAIQLSDEHGLSFKLEKGSFNRGQFRMHLKFGVPAIEAEMHQEFIQRYLPVVGLPLDVIGQTYQNEDGTRYTVVDLSEKLDMKCVRVVHEGQTEPRYKVSPRKVREGLGIPEPEMDAEEAAEEQDEADA